MKRLRWLGVLLAVVGLMAFAIPAVQADTPPLYLFWSYSSAGCREVSRSAPCSPVQGIATCTGQGPAQSMDVIASEPNYGTVSMKATLGTQVWQGWNYVNDFGVPVIDQLNHNQSPWVNSALSCTVNHSNGLMDYFGIDHSGNLIHGWESGGNGNACSDQSCVHTSSLGNPGIGLFSASGRWYSATQLNVFAVDYNNHMWGQNFTQGCLCWSGWINIDNLGLPNETALNVALCAGTISPEDLFYVGTDRNIYTDFWDGANWHPGSRLNVDGNNVSVACTEDDPGRYPGNVGEIITTTLAGNVNYEMWLPGWQPWQTIGHPASNGGFGPSGQAGIVFSHNGTEVDVFADGSGNIDHWSTAAIDHNNWCYEGDEGGPDNPAGCGTPA